MHRDTNIMKIHMFLWCLLSLLFSVNSTKALASSEFYQCDLNFTDSKSKQWYPDTLEMVFIDGGESVRIASQRHLERPVITQYDSTFKKVTGVEYWPTIDGARLLYTITILKDTRVYYEIRIVQEQKTYMVKGKCTRRVVQSADNLAIGGLFQGITPDYKVSKLCAESPSNCSILDLCVKATESDTSGTRSWSNSLSAFPYIKKALEINQNCNIVWNNNCNANPKGKTCSAALLCRLRTDCEAPSSSSTPIIKTCATNTNKCNDTELCGKATYFTGKRQAWETDRDAFTYVIEAKKRGISCGVASSSSTPIVETKVPKVAPSAVPKKNPQTPIKSSPSLIDPLHIKNYGKTYHTALLPKVIFFIGEIEDGDEQDFRRALRSHDVDTVVLLSGGGLIYNGLELANIIFDNNLTTYIPAKETCASACAFMFFAGNQKVAHGRLGVHQFFVEDDKKKVEIGKVQKGTQRLVADIIRNLTDFGTPPSVFSKMFATSGMYFFSEKEKRAFSDSNKLSPETVTRINEVLSYFIKDFDDELNDVVLNGMPQEVKSSLIQLELLRIGCMQGPVDGIKGAATTAAIQLLSEKRDSNLSALKFSGLFRRLNNTKPGACY